MPHPPTSPQPGETITAVILAGGRARRMGGADKGLLQLAGKPLVEHVSAALVSQVEHIIVNANRHTEAYARLGYPVIADTVPDQPGPLAGLLAALEYVREGCVLSVPCDTPFLPNDLVARLRSALISNAAEVATVHDGARLQQAVLLVRPCAALSLRTTLQNGQHKVEAWLRSRTYATADFSDQPHAFINVNTPQELARLERERFSNDR